MQESKLTLKREHATLCFDGFSASNKKTKYSECKEISMQFSKLLSYLKVNYSEIVLPHYETASEFMKGGKPIHFAAQHLDTKLLALLLSSEADINQLDFRNDNALMTACKTFMTNLCKRTQTQHLIRDLLNNGCNPFQKNLSGDCALDLIGKHQLLRPKEILELLDKLSDEQLKHATGLLHKTDIFEIIDYFVSRHIPIDALDYRGRSPLYCAFERSNIEVIEHLIKLGANFSISLPYREMAQLTIEMITFSNHNMEVKNNVDDIDWLPFKDQKFTEKVSSPDKAIQLFRLIKKYGRNLNESDKQGDTPLIIITRNLQFHPGHNFTISLFIETLVNLGCDLTQQNFAGECAIELLAKSKKFKDYEIRSFVELIPKENLPLAGRILHHIRDIELIQYLHNNKVSIETPDENGNTPLLHAISLGNTPLVKFYIQLGADIKVGLPFHLLARTDNIELLDYIFTIRNDINSVNSNNDNALLISCQCFDELKYLKLAALDEKILLKLQHQDYDEEAYESVCESPQVAFRALSRHQKKADEYRLRAQEFIYKLLTLGANAFQTNLQGVCAAELFVKFNVFDDKVLHRNFSKVSAEQLSIAKRIIHHTSNLELITLFIEKGISVNSFDDHGNTLLDKAIENYDVDMVKFLLDKGANSELPRPNNFKSRKDYPQTAQDLLNQKMIKLKNAVNSTNSYKYQKQLNECIKIDKMLNPQNDSDTASSGETQDTQEI